MSTSKRGSKLFSINFIASVILLGVLLQGAAAFAQLGANLVETGVGVAGTLASGGSITVTDTVTNQGSTSAGSTYTYFYLSSDGATKGNMLWYRNVPPLASGASSGPAQTNMTLPSDLSGTRYVLACANATDTTAESCTASAPFTIGAADLIETGVSVTGTISAGRAIAVTDTTANQGSGSANGSYTYLYLSANGTTPGAMLGYHYVAPLAGGTSSAPAHTGVTLPASLPSPSYLLACANGNHTVVESNTANDCASVPLVAAAAPTPTPTPSPLQLTTSSLPAGQVSQAYSATLTASGGSAPYTWSVVSGSVGAGMSLSTSGTIAGTPTAAGQYSFSVQVADSTSQAATVPMILTVANVGPIVATNLLPTATVNAAYSATLTASGGAAPYSWTITGGALPSGVSLSAAGVIAGTPAAAGAFPVTVQLSDSTGRTATASESLTVAATSVPGFQKPFAATSFWNTPIPALATTDPQSTTMIQQSILNFLAQNITFSNGGYGMPLAYASASNKVYTVSCTQTCGPGATSGSVQFPIPAGATPASGTDHHLVVAYQAMDGSPYAGKELDMWEASYDASNDTWSAQGVAVTDLSSAGWGAECAMHQNCSSNVAAGFAGLGGAVRPEEIAQGHIDHALAIATPYNRTGGYFACPATHLDQINGSSSALPEGAQIQLDPTFNVDAQSWPAWVKTIAHALQTYGAYNRDFSGVVVLYGITDQNAGVPSWSSVGVPTDSYGDLNMIPWNLMRVITMTGC